MDTKVQALIDKLQARITRYNTITSIVVLVLSSIIIPLSFLDITSTRNYILILLMCLVFFVYRAHQKIKALEQLVSIFQTALNKKK